MLAQKDERYQGVEKHSSGFKLLASMGWKEGEGLGAKRQGMKHHIKVKKVQENAGIGLAEARRQAKDWTVGMAAYDLVLAKLANASSQPSADEECAEQGKSKKRKQASSGNEQSSNAAAAMPPAKISKKKKLSSSTEASIGRGDEAAAGQKAAGAAALERSSSPAEGGGAAEQAAAAKASHTARFSRRRAGKNVRSYSGTDLAAILGGQSSKAAPSPQVDKLAPSDSAPRRLVVEIQERALPFPEAANDNQEQPGDEERWWYSGFVRSGRLGSAAPKPALAPTAKPKVKINGFSEDDQANLYMMAHDAKGDGRQGLGIASRPKKVAGARWQGTKKRLEESSDEDAPEPAAVEAPQPADSEDCSEDTHVSSKGEELAHAEQEDVEQPAQHQVLLPEAAATKDSASAKILMKYAKRVLEAAPGGQLKQKKLEKRVLDLLEVQRGSSQRRQTRKALLAALKASAKLIICDGVVSL